MSVIKNKKDKRKFYTQGETSMSQEEEYTKEHMKKIIEEKEKRKYKRRKIINRLIVMVMCAAIGAGVIVYAVSAVGDSSAYFKMGDEAISKAEFDYHYNTYKNQYYSNYGETYFGIDTSVDPKEQMYDEDTSWHEFFEEQAVEDIKEIKALKADGHNSGFEYDATNDFYAFEDDIIAQAKNIGSSMDQLSMNLYGHKISKLKSAIMDEMYAGQYMKYLYDSKDITEEEINTEYDNNKNLYDNVSYYVVNIGANVSDDILQAETLTEEQQAEADSAMKIVKEYADLFSQLHDPSVFVSEAINRGLLQADEPEIVSGKNDFYDPEIADWLYDDTRIAGDTKVVPYESSYTYSVYCFASREQNIDDTVSSQIISITKPAEDNKEQEYTLEIAEGLKNTLSDMWEDSDNNADTFLALSENIDPENEFANYTDYISTYNYDFISEKMTESDGYNEDIISWLFDTNRKDGDYTIIETDNAYYLIRFNNHEDVWWKETAKENLISRNVTDHVNKIKEDFIVTDDKDNLMYI